MGPFPISMADKAGYLLTAHFVITLLCIHRRKVIYPAFLHPRSFLCIQIAGMIPSGPPSDSKNTMPKILLAFLLLTFSWTACADILSGRVVKVADGDTITVLDADHTQHRIRLQGIDAPERGQAYGRKSGQYLSEAVAGQQVTVEYGKRDQYRRIVGTVLLDGRDMNLRQIEAGLAWHYKQYQKVQSAEDRRRYADAELVAREHRRGLWQETDPVAPWEWRKRKREGR